MSDHDRITSWHGKELHPSHVFILLKGAVAQDCTGCGCQVCGDQALLPCPAPYTDPVALGQALIEIRDLCQRQVDLASALRDTQMETNRLLQEQNVTLGAIYSMGRGYPS